MEVINKTITLPSGKEVHLESGRLAKQADGSVVLRCGETMLLATVVASKESNTEIDWLPLSVDYVEKYAAAGKIPGGFFKREGRLGEGEILTSRLVDRALRPLFPSDYHGDVQVIITLMSADSEEQPDALACLAACGALMASDVPFPEPVSEVRVIRKEGEFHINPTLSEMEGNDLDLMVAGTADSIIMVEGEMQEVSEEVMLEAMIAAHEAIQNQCNLLLEFKEEVGKGVREYDKPEGYPELEKRVAEICEQEISDVSHGALPKQERSSRIEAVKAKAIEELTVEFGPKEDDPDAEVISDVEGKINALLKKLQKKVVRKMMIGEKTRLDGRNLDEVRDIWSEVSYLPRAHGSAVFTRGETQSLCTTTLGTKLDEQTIDKVMMKGSKRFMLHYNFPPFSTGERKFLRGPARREIGHGNLAERALKPMIADDYEYTVRVVSEILESNGSSSMATVCGGTMSLMDAGVPIKAPVSGIAMGLATDDEGNYAVLSDILGDEDFLGDMDFKVAGTKDGLTACQMDMKVRGLSYEILRDALEQSKAGRLHILDEMLKTISETREELSPYAPRISQMAIPSDLIGTVIGPGGKVIQDMQKTTGTTINIEEVGNQGIVTIYSVDKSSLDAAVAMVKAIVAEPEVGETYQAKVKSIKDFGAFVEFMPGKEGLLHISEISYSRLESMEGVLEVGEEFPIKLIGIDPRNGKFRLSRKALLPKPEGYVEPERRGGRGGGDRRGGGGDRRGGGGNRGGGNRGGGGRGRY